MALPRPSLSKKIVALLGMLTLLQLGIMTAVGCIGWRMQLVSERADRARKAKECTYELVNQRFKVIAFCESKSLMTHGLGDPLFGQEQADLYQQIVSLKELMKDRPDDLAIVQKSERAALQALATLHQLKMMFDQGNIQDRPERKPMIERLRQNTVEIVSPELVQLAIREGVEANAAPAELKRLRVWLFWLVGLGGLSALLVTGGTALFLIRRVTLPVEQMLDDAAILAERSKISFAEKEGEAEEKDEIVRMEILFGSMARTIKEITAKQLAVVDNAGDMVCTIDDNGKITSANTAAGRLFSCHQADLIDKHYRDLVHRKDAGLLSDYLQRARSGTPGKPITLRCLSRNRRILVVRWSAQWTASEEQYFCVVHDLTHLHEAQKMKQEIVAIASRDLRAPIADLHEFLDLLEEGSIARVEERGQRLLVSAKRNTDQMLMLVNDMIDLEKAKGGLLTVNHQDIVLDGVIDRAQVMVAPFAEEKNIVLDCRRSGLTIRGEEDKLLRIFTNLLGSAVQRAPAESSVLLVSKGQDKDVQITVSDKGSAISKEQLATIFDAYTAGESGTSAEEHESSASKLGLAVSKAFVELHGGTIAANSKEGEGNTFTLTLPLAASSIGQKARAT